MRNITKFQLENLNVLIIFSFLLSACSNSDENSLGNNSACEDKVELTQISKIKAENDSLKPEFNKLKEENETLKLEQSRLTEVIKDLQLNPSTLLSSLQVEINAGSLEKSQIALNKLIQKYPNTKESNTGKKLVESLDKKLLDSEKESRRIALLGLKSLKVLPIFQFNDLTLKLISSNISNKWSFDEHGDEYMYRESEKDSKFITAKISVSAKSKDPSLFGIGLYVEGKGLLNLIGRFKYEFQRWTDYGSYLGNSADFRNDFAHTTTIPFTIGASILNDDVHKPIYLIITKEGCNTRLYHEFSRPQVSYSSYKCDSLKESLSIDDFKDGGLAVLKRIN